MNLTQNLTGQVALCDPDGWGFHCERWAGEVLASVGDISQ